MAHNLNSVEGKVAFASTQPAWHGLGQIVEGAMTSKECIEKAGLDYTIENSEVTGKDKNGNDLIVPDTFITYRSDTNDVLGVVGSRYHIVQNSECFSFFDSIVGEGKAIYETAGALGKGEKIFITAKLPTDIVIGSDDILKNYLVLVASHDGSCSIMAMFTPVRVVCQNTLMAATKQTITSTKIRHTKEYKSKLEQAHTLLGIAKASTEEFGSMFGVMAETKMNDTQLTTYIDSIFAAKNETVSTRMKNIRNSILEYAEIGAGQDMVTTKGTVWGAYNAITGYIDHIKGDKGDQSTKLVSSWFGESANIRQKAFDLALNLI